MSPTLGLVVNPIAGMGGTVGLKGTDGADILTEALRLGALPAAGARATLALARLVNSAAPFQLLTAPGEMGERVARELGLTPEVVGNVASYESTSADTQAAARMMANRSVDMILFVGGDGTARDILAAVGNQVPVLGVPAGVKMHSAVFGTNPVNAGHLAGLFLNQNPAARLRDAEVMDLDETEIRKDRVSARLYGYARSPFERHLAQNAKSGSRVGGEGDVDAAALEIAGNMLPGCLYILGPGTTTHRVAHALGLNSTLLGVDAILDGRLVRADADESVLLHLLGSADDARIVIGVLGGQGSLFGRGNQQISSRVIDQVGLDHIIVLSSVEKLVDLGNAPLQVDTGDLELDARLAGYVRVRTGYGRSMILKVAS